MKYEIGNRIRKYREDRGLSQMKLAQMINVSNNRISNWEQGINRPDADIIAAICKALDVSPSELLDVRLSSDDLNDQERKVIKAYRTETQLQNAVNILLGIVEKK
ncbi:MAG: helix-turn-helix transcriptional regulator [Oscillospiraceae bacterium]